VKKISHLCKYLALALLTEPELSSVLLAELSLSVSSPLEMSAIVFFSDSEQVHCEQSRSVDPYNLVTDPDSALFVSGFQDVNKNKIFPNFFLLFEVHLHHSSSHKEVTTVEKIVFLFFD
jgi:hypothetical protein